MPTMKDPRLLLVALLALLGACTYQGGDDPVSRKFSWFSYLDAADIRDACRPGTPERYRFIYNAIYKEQIRTYDLTGGAGSRGQRMKVRAIEAPNLTEIKIGAPPDLLSPWRGKGEEVWLTPAQAGELQRAMNAGGVFAGAPDGLNLHSDDFYWVVAACSEGRFHFNAYHWPSERFDKAAFPALLFAWDPTGVRPNMPRQTTTFELYHTSNPDKYPRFNIKIGKAGLDHPGPWF